MKATQMPTISQSDLRILLTIFQTPMLEIEARSGISKSRAHRIIRQEVLADGETVRRLALAIVGATEVRDDREASAA